MIDLLKAKIAELKSREQKYNLTREYLQILALKILSDAQMFQSIAFIGGTALRILYRVRRYSEDLDFSVVKSELYNFEKILEILDRELYLLNIEVEFKKKRGVVDTLMINFVSVLQELGISVAKDQKLSIKLEVDTKPPAGAVTQETIVNADFIFPIRHYDLSSLMSGKLHAILCRKYTKGRDFYDLLWYLSRRTKPNLPLLENALFQTEKERHNLTKDSWQTLLKERFSKVDFKKARRDVEPFIEDFNEVGLIEETRFVQLLAWYK